MTEIPDRLPISGKRGSKNLSTLSKRMLYLEERIVKSTKDLSWDKQEAAALRWAITQIIMYEDLLKTGGPEEGATPT